MAEILNNPILKGPLTASRVGSSNVNQFSGFTTLAAAAATVVVSTTSVKSDSGVMCQIMGTAVTSSFPLQVASIVEGKSFSIMQSNGAVAGANTSIFWMIVNKR